jgi:hypothetical protein
MFNQLGLYRFVISFDETKTAIFVSLSTWCSLVFWTRVCVDSANKTIVLTDDICGQTPLHQISPEHTLAYLMPGFLSDGHELSIDSMERKKNRIMRRMILKYE